MTIYVKEIPGFATRDAADAEAEIWKLQGLITETEPCRSGAHETFSLVIYFPKTPFANTDFGNTHIPQCPLLRRIARYMTGFNWDYCEPELNIDPVSRQSPRQINMAISAVDESAREYARVGCFALPLAEILQKKDFNQTLATADFTPKNQERIASTYLSGLWGEAGKDLTCFEKRLGTVWPNIVPATDEKADNGDRSSDDREPAGLNALQQALKTFTDTQPSTDKS